MKTPPRITTRHNLRLESLEPRELLAGDTLAVTPTSGAIEANDDVALRLIVRNTFVPGVPFVVRAQLESADGTVQRDTWDAAIQLSSTTPGTSLAAEPMVLRNGMGSSLVTIDDHIDVSLTAQWGETIVEKQLTALVRPTTHKISGTLDADSMLRGVVHITDDLHIPEGRHLEIAPGTLILIDGSARSTDGKRIVVEGSLTAAGSLDEPITLTAMNPDQPWGEIDVSGGTVNLSHTIISRAGSSPRGGHTSTGPAIRLTDQGELTMSESTIADISGKIMQASSGQVEMDGVLLTRAVMGPEIEDTSLDFRDSWIIEMAGQYHHNGTVDDNDGIYLRAQSEGQQIVLQRAVVADVQDDGIDTLRSHVVIRDTIVRDAADKAVSVFSGEVLIEHSLLVNSAIGVETKGSGSSTPKTSLDRTTIANVALGVHAFDKGPPDPDVVISYDITNSIIHVVPNGDAIKTDYDPDDLRINYSLSKEPWNFAGSGTGNVNSDPLFVDLSANDFRLSNNSPAIDAGDPNASKDEDGTRADLGFFPVYQTPNAGDLNGDGNIDARDVDLICAAIRDGQHDARLDLDANGKLDIADHTQLIEELLRTVPGDANLDGTFDSSDLVAVFQAGEYEDGIQGNSGWAQGDWNCDGEFSSGDLIAAFQSGRFAAAAKANTAGPVGAAIDKDGRP